MTETTIYCAVAAVSGIVALCSVLFALEARDSAYRERALRETLERELLREREKPAKNRREPHPDG